MLAVIRSGGLARVWVALAVLATVATACTSPAKRAAAPTAAGPAKPRYQVDAQVGYLPQTGQAWACRGDAPLDSPMPCTGVPLRGAAFLRRLPIELRLRKGLISQTVLLVGTWDGHALTLTAPPRPVGPNERFPTTRPATCHGQQTPASITLSNRILGASRTVGLFQMIPCGTKVWIEVRILTPQVRAYIEQHFGPNVYVDSWLTPAPS